MPAERPPTPALSLPATVRNAVTEWVAKGFAVEVRGDGTIRVEPAKTMVLEDQFDLVDMKRRK